MNNVQATEEEVMELVPHITLNPSFNIDMLEYIEAEVSPTDACEKTSLVKACNESSNRRGPIMWNDESNRNRSSLRESQLEALLLVFETIYGTISHALLLWFLFWSATNLAYFNSS